MDFDGRRRLLTEEIRDSSDLFEFRTKYSCWLVWHVKGATLLENKRRRGGHVSSCRKIVGDINVALLAFVFISEGIL